jgi:hypothetical protein
VRLAEWRAEEEISRRLDAAYQRIQREVIMAQREEHANHLRSHAGLINVLEQECEQTRLQMLRVHHAEHGLLAEASELAGHANALELHAFLFGQQATLEEAAAEHRVVVERFENHSLAEHELRMQSIRQQTHEQIALERLRIEQEADQALRAELAEAQRRAEHAEAYTKSLAEQGMNALAAELQEREDARVRMIEAQARAHLDEAEREQRRTLESY